MNSWILQLAAFALLLTILYELLPAGEMKRVTGAALAVLFALRLLTPIVSVGKSQIASWLLSFDRYTEDLPGGENGLTEEILADYEARCNTEIANYLARQEEVASARCKVVLETDPEAEAFGQLQHIYAYVNFSKENEEERWHSWIEPIVILPGILGNDNREEDKAQDAKREALAESLSAWLQIDRARITVFEEDL